MPLKTTLWELHSTVWEIRCGISLGCLWITTTWYIYIYKISNFAAVVTNRGAFSPFFMETFRFVHACFEHSHMKCATQVYDVQTHGRHLFSTDWIRHIRCLFWFMRFNFNVFRCLCFLSSFFGPFYCQFSILIVIVFYCLGILQNISKCFCFFLSFFNFKFSNFLVTIFSIQVQYNSWDFGIFHRFSNFSSKIPQKCSSFFTISYSLFN